VPGEAGGEADKRYAPATLRNRDAIVDVLRTVLPEHGLVLEIASGSGEHAVHFARNFPALDWQPSDPDPVAIASIAAWSGEAGLANVRPPVRIDAAGGGWLVTQADAILCINMAHIAPWAATLGLFREAAGTLGPGAPLILYGPYVEAGVETALSNVAFDGSLKERDPEWGLRDVADMDAVAVEFGFARMGRVEMPANNLMLIYCCVGVA
jgi:SAM-dependent methyltransferase